MSDTLKILLLEDSPFDAELEIRILRRDFPDAEIQLVSNRSMFVNVLETSEPSVVLSDNSLPDIDAKEALTISRRIYPYIPFIMVSGTVGEEFASEIIRIGADDYILKDRLGRLTAAIDTAITLRAQEREKVQALELLRANEEKYRTLVERVSDAFIAFDKEFRFTYLNDRAVTMLRKSADELLGKNVWDAFPEAIDSLSYHSLQKAMREQQYVCNVDYFAPLDLWQENHIYPSPDGLSLFIRDISEQRKAQEAVREMETKVQEQRVQYQKSVTRAMIHAQENERRRLGQEMHDNINQILSASKFYLTKGKTDLPDDIKYPIELIDKAIEEIRLLSRQYVTPHSNVDLQGLVQKLIRELKNSTGVEAELVYDLGNLHPSDDLKLNVYRVIQEQVNNIIKYASAKNVSILIEAKGKQLEVAIADDGIGFDVNAPRQGIGIANMTNRVEAFNGIFEITSAPGHGCTIEISLPV